VSKDRPKNVAASVKAWLTDLGRREGEEFQLVLTRYAIKRLLYRLASSVAGGVAFDRTWAAGGPWQPAG
jgi:hypothetical protein